MKKQYTILIVEDHIITRENIKGLLTAEYFILEAASYSEAVEKVFQHNVHLVILDLNLPDSRGIRTVTDFINFSPELPVIVLTVESDPHTAAKVIQKGAREYILKKGIYDNSSYLLKRISELIKEYAGNTIDTDDSTDLFFPVTQDFQEIYKKAVMAIKESFHLLILGETGVGKSCLVKHLHKKIAPDLPLMVIDLGCIPESLQDAELFGVKRGAFNEAREDRTGLIEKAHNGILFLDEISNAPLSLQQRLLRLIEDGVIRRVGDNRERPVKCLLISASNRDLEKEVESGRFRLDLLHRIRETQIILPPLRNNQKILSQFMDFFLTMYNKKCGAQFRPDEKIYTQLLRHQWKGNIRELKNIIKQLVYYNKYNLSIDDILIVNKISLELEKNAESGMKKEFDEILLDLIMQEFKAKEKTDLSLNDFLQKIEEEILYYSLKQCDGNQTQAAQKIGLHRNTFQSKMKSIEKNKHG